MSEPTQAQLDLVTERKRQDQQWGIQNHDPGRWLVIAGEEYGEACKAHLEGDLTTYRDEMIHLCAVSLAAVESLDRNRNAAPPNPRSRLEITRRAITFLLTRRGFSIWWDTIDEKTKRELLREMEASL